jgi:hypothetical protein
MAPEITITAEALLAGFAEREMADENDDDAALRVLGERWRPDFWRETLGLDTVGNLSWRLRGQLSDSDGRYTRPFRRLVDRSRPPPRRLHPKERLATLHMLGPPFLPNGC